MATRRTSRVARPTAVAAAHRSGPDLIVLAARCYVSFPYAPSSGPQRGRTIDAVAIHAGRIVALGPQREIRKLAIGRTRVLDLRPAVLTAGLVDAHTHFFYWAMARSLVIDVSACRTLEEALDAIQRGARRQLGSEWVVARGFDCNVWQRGFPTASDLDRAVRNRPALVRSRDGHAAWLNTLGLREAGIAGDTPDPPGGKFLRDVRGRPTGIAQETAVERLPNPLGELALRSDAHARGVVDHVLEAGYAEAWRLGITGVHTMDDAPSLTALQRHHSEHKLGVRIVHSLPLERLGEAARLGLRGGLGDDWLQLGAVKIFADGTLGSQTAFMFDPYPEVATRTPQDSRRRRPTAYCGVPVLAGDALRVAVGEAAVHGWPVWIHAIGDRAAHEAIAAIAAARRIETRLLPHRIEHAQCVRPADIRRMARLGIAASVQPCHLINDIGNADRHWPRARRDAFPLRRMLDAGVLMPLGSDAPIESLDPRRSFFAAINRTDVSGHPVGGWFPQQRISPAEVLRGFTEHAARSVGQAAPAGTLLPGAPADITVWLDDPLESAARDWLRLRIAGCLIDGVPHLA